LRAAFTIVGVRDWDVAVLGVANLVRHGAMAGRVHFKAPLATVAAVTISVVTWFHADKAVVADLGTTVFILDEVDFACQRWIGPCARSLCSLEWGNGEQGR
jgi:hypothetical protein